MSLHEINRQRVFCCLDELMTIDFGNHVDSILDASGVWKKTRYIRTYCCGDSGQNVKNFFFYRELNTSLWIESFFVCECKLKAFSLVIRELIGEKKNENGLFAGSTTRESHFVYA